MSWLHPTYAWALLAVPVAAYSCWRAARAYRAAQARFGDRTLVQQLMEGVRPGRRTATAGLGVAALALLVVGLMGPRLGTQTRTVEQRGVDLVVALDVSASMQAQDVAPSRLRRAKREVRALVDRLGGDRVGLVLFSGEGFVQCPLTSDYGAFRLFLDATEADALPVPGTNLRAAFEAGLEAFDTARPPSDSTRPPDERRSRALLFLSDGENHEGDLDAIRRRADAQGVTLFTAGVGTEQGAQIPVYEDGQRVGVKRTADGEIVRTRLDEPALTSLAEDGAYFRVGGTSSALADVATALRQLEETPMEEERFAAYNEYFQWPLALALLLLAVEICIPVRVRPSDTDANPPSFPFVQS
ncbi:MAG: VWA domain-containing protein [Salinibacter sp.]